MVWGIIMFICGILAIALPLASSVGIVIVLAWLILFAGVCHLIFAFQSHSIGGFLWKVLLAIVYGFAGVYMLMHPLLGVISLTFLASDLFSDRRSGGDYFLLQDSRSRERGLGFVRWHCHADSRIFNLAPMAVELGVGHRNLGRHQLDL